MAAEINWHRYGTKLRNCHPMYMLRPDVRLSVTSRCCVERLNASSRFSTQNSLLASPSLLLGTSDFSIKKARTLHGHLVHSRTLNVVDFLPRYVDRRKYCHLISSVASLGVSVNKDYY